MSDPYVILGAALPVAALGGSIAVLAWLFAKHIAGQPLLEYERRTPVPWNALAPLAILAPTVIAIALGLLSAAAPPPAEAPAETEAPLAVTTSSVPPDAGADAGHVWFMAAAFMTLAVTCHLALAAVWRATAVDLGWPASWGQLGRDARIGAAACLAMLAPVYAIQLLLLLFVEHPQEHPLLEELKSEPSPVMFLATAAAAVIAAPLFEETAFRLVFQGWMERVAALARRRRTVSAAAEPINPPPLPWPTASSDVGQSPDAADGAATMAAPGVGGAAPAESAAPLVFDDRPAWAPVVISGSIFALAHLGQGVAPVSLLPLGLALGYVYQRTHRLVPSLVCHALFNGFSMLVAWLAIKSGAM
jgi:membrane protease YdiL (CAAX protease family)